MQKHESRLILLGHGNGVRRCRLRFLREIGCKQDATKLAPAMKAFSYGRTNGENRNTGSPEDFFRYGTAQQLHGAGASMRTQIHQVNLTLVQCLLDWRPNRLGPDKHGLVRDSNELRHRSM